MDPALEGTIKDGKTSTEKEAKRAASVCFFLSTLDGGQVRVPTLIQDETWNSKAKLLCVRAFYHRHRDKTGIAANTQECIKKTAGWATLVCIKWA